MCAKHTAFTLHSLPSLGRTKKFVNECLSLYQLKQKVHKQLIDINRCTGFTGCLLDLVLQRRFSSMLYCLPKNTLSLMSKQRNTCPSSKYIKLQITDNLVNVSLPLFNEMLGKAGFPHSLKAITSGAHNYLGFVHFFSTLTVI